MTGLHVACACGAEATHRFHLFWDDGDPPHEIQCCKACGERYHEETCAMQDARNQLARKGVGERMIGRIIAQQIARRELLASIPLSDELRKQMSGQD